MENISVTRLVRLINSLSIELRLEILSKLSDKLKVDFNGKKDSKEKLLDELFGSWKDFDYNLADDIMNNRSLSDKNISLD